MDHVAYGVNINFDGTRSHLTKLNYFSSAISSATHWPSISEPNSSQEEKTKNIFLQVTNLRTWEEIPQTGKIIIITLSIFFWVKSV